MTKRLLDIVFSLLALIIVFPWLCLAIWIGNKLSHSVGPLFFTQLRTGLNGKTFRMWKFRTMVVNDQADTLQAVPGDCRITSFGKRLRHTSLDEVPQIINVLRGDMSIIGPRPHMLYHTELYTPLIPHYMDRHKVKPGLTGWAQVNGSRGETRTLADMTERVNYDLWYVEHQSFRLDWIIFWRTIRLIFVNEKKAI